MRMSFLTLALFAMRAASPAVRCLYSSAFSFSADAKEDSVMRRSASFARIMLFSHICVSRINAVFFEGRIVDTSSGVIFFPLKVTSFPWESFPIKGPSFNPSLFAFAILIFLLSFSVKLYPRLGTECSRGIASILYSSVSCTVERLFMSSSIMERVSLFSKMQECIR